MAATVTISDLKCIFETSLDDPCLQAFIDDACLLVDSLGIEAECGSASANAVAKYLAAHYAAHRDQRQTSQSTLDASETFGSALGLGFDSTQYGQTAKRFDCTGKLSNMDTNDKNGSVKPRHIFCVTGR